jgi:hypothetical protein
MFHVPISYVYQHNYMFLFMGQIAGKLNYSTQPQQMSVET